MTLVQTFDTIYIHTFSTRDGHVPTLRERFEMRKHCGPYQWKPSAPGQGRAFYMASHAFEMGDSTLKLRVEPANDHLPRTSHFRQTRADGYYTSDDCTDTIQPIIARLPHGRGFLAGWTMGHGMISAVDSTVYDDISECARQAHQEAESQADREREANERDRDERILEDTISRLTRDQCVSILESNGFTVYESETTAELREAISVNVADGTIDESDIDTEVNN